MTKVKTDYLNHFNEAVAHFGKFCFCTPDTDLQKEASSELYSFLQQLGEDKADAVAANDEMWANVLLGCECLLRGIRADILMWIALKEGQADAAWGLLVDAQGFVADAMKADPGFELQPRVEQLAMLERTVFPPQSFLSAGMTVGYEECSICGNDYEDCEHIKGKPYMGEFCVVRLMNCVPDHVALVDEPASKHCRIQTFSTPEGNKSKMTLLVEPYKDVDGPPKEGMVAKAIILHLAPEEF